MKLFELKINRSVNIIANYPIYPITKVPHLINIDYWFRNNVDVIYKLIVEI